MGEAEVSLFQSWVDQAVVADDPLAFWYEHSWAPAIDYRAIEGSIDDGGPIVGRDAMRAYLADWYDMFPDLELVADEIVDAGSNRVIVEWHITGTAKASGVPTELRVSVLYTIHAGRVVRGREYATKEDALAAAANQG